MGWNHQPDRNFCLGEICARNSVLQSWRPRWMMCLAFWSAFICPSIPEWVYNFLYFLCYHLMGFELCSLPEPWGRSDISFPIGWPTVCCPSVSYYCGQFFFGPRISYWTCLEPAKHAVQAWHSRCIFCTRLWLFFWIKFMSISSLTCVDCTQLHIFTLARVSPSLTLWRGTSLAEAQEGLPWKCHWWG